MTTQEVVFSYRFASIPNLLEYDDGQPSRRPKRPTNKTSARSHHRRDRQDLVLTFRRLLGPRDTHRHRSLRECDARAIRIVQHPWTQFSAPNGPTVGALVTPVCGEACHKKAFDSIRENWQENMRAWLEGKLDEGPVRAPDTKMKDVRFTFMFPTGHQMNLIHTHPLPARLCANTDDKNDKAVQRAMQDELRQVTC